MERKIAMNGRRHPNMGCATECDLSDYDKLTKEPWLAQMVTQIREGKEELKRELPFRAAHYSRFANNHRTQKDAVPESFLFQTTVDIDKPELVEVCLKRALEMNADEASPWKGMLLHGDYSARNKLHLDVRMPIGMTVAETQRAYCEALGISDEYDESCTSPERIIYITDASQEVFRSDDWYARLSDDELEVRRKAFADRSLTIDGRNRDGSRVSAPKVKTESVPDNRTPSAPPPGETGMGAECVTAATPASLKAFELCVNQAGLNESELDVWGEHNWHANLMAVLSVGLPKLMTREQLHAVVREKLPNYSQTHDCRTLIDYFYEKYSADKGFMSSSLREINAEAQKAGIKAGSEESRDNKGREEDPLMDSMRQGWDPPEMPKKLPRIVWLLIKPYPEQYHPVLAVTAMLMLGAIASHYRAVYLDGRVVSPNLYAAFIAGSGKGKGWISKLCDQMCENTLQAWDEAEWQKVHDNAEMRERMKNSKECPPKYHPKLRIMETMSKTSLLEVQTNLGENGMVFCKYSESDELANSSKAAFSNLSVILRKAWDMDMHRQFYMSDASCNTQCRLNAAILLTGTPKSVLTRLFSDTENGMMQRFMPMILPKMKRQFRPPKYMGLTPEEKKELDGLLIGLWQKDLSLGDKVLTLEMPKTEKMVGEWYDALEERYNDGQVTEAEADLSHRVGQFMMRAAIPFVAMDGEESREMLELVRWLGDVSYYNICHIFGMRVAQDMKESQELMEQNFDRRKTIEPLLSRLPEVFTVKQLQEQRVRDGQSPDVKMLLSRYCKSGKLVKVGKGLYRKVSS